MFEGKLVFAAGNFGDFDIFLYDLSSNKLTAVDFRRRLERLPSLFARWRQDCIWLDPKRQAGNLDDECGRQ